jgi:hypothetical protein
MFFLKLKHKMKTKPIQFENKLKKCLCMIKNCISVPVRLLKWITLENVNMI